MEFVQEKNGKEIEQHCQERIGVASSGKFDTKESLYRKKKKKIAIHLFVNQDYHLVH